MHDNNKEEIRAVANKLKLNDFVVEKDIYVTQAIDIATKVQNEFFELVFQGGTCLAKAHRIIKRMS